MTGKAQNAWRRLTQEAKDRYATAKSALHKKFEPDSRRSFTKLNSKSGGVNKESHVWNWPTIYGYLPIKLSQA